MDFDRRDGVLTELGKKRWYSGWTLAGELIYCEWIWAGDIVI